MTALTHHRNRALRWVGTAAAATGLFVVPLGVAGAATSHKSTAHSSTTTSAPAHRESHGDASSMSRPDREAGPHLDGKVVAVSVTTVTVADRDGFWRTINLSDSTTYTNIGVAATKDAVTVGSFVAARGTVNADHTSLDATTLDVAPTPPHDGPEAPFGHR